MKSVGCGRAQVKSKSMERILWVERFKKGWSWGTEDRREQEERVTKLKMYEKASIKLLFCKSIKIIFKLWIQRHLERVNNASSRSHKLLNENFSVLYRITSYKLMIRDAPGTPKQYSLLPLFLAAHQGQMVRLHKNTSHTTLQNTEKSNQS